MTEISRHLLVCASALQAAILSVLPLDGFAAKPYPTALADLSAVLAIEDAAARAEAAECFIEDLVFYDFPELEPVVRVMLDDEESRVRWAGLSVLGASLWAGKTTGADMRQWMSETLVAVLATDPSTGNRGLAAILIGEMDVIPENQVRAPLLDLLSQSDTKAARDALNTLQRFSQPPLEDIEAALLNRTQNPSSKERGFGYRGLGETAGRSQGVAPEVIEALAAGMQEQDRSARLAAIGAIRQLGPDAASLEPDLQEIAWNPKEPPDVRKAAQEAIEAITGVPITPPWLTSPPETPVGAGGAPQ